MDPRFGKVDDQTDQPPSYDAAANKVAFSGASGAGNVTVSTTKKSGVHV